MTVKMITAPTAEPVTLADAKLVCGIDADITKWDTLITALISAARSDAEQQTGRTIAAARWERVLDAFPDSGIALAWPVVTSVVSVKYVDTAGELQTLASTAYTLDADFLPGWVLPSAASPAWPDTLDTANAVRVQFDTAWDAAVAVPEEVKSWIKMRVASLFKFREMVAAGVSVAELPRGHGDGLLDKWRLYL